TNLLRVALQCLMVQKGMLFLHAACIEYDGRAVAFSGDSGVGKSTRAASWVAALSAQWISGDRPLLCHKKNEYYACGLPWDGKEQIIRSVEVSLLTILQVHRAGFQRLRRMTPEQARNLLMSQCFIPMWDTQTAIKAMETIRYMSEQIHFCHVFCGADEESAKELWQLLYSKPMKVMEEKEMLKVKKGFKISKVAGEYMAIPVGEMVKEFDGTVILNEVSAFIFRHLADGISREDLQDLILEEFEVSADRAGKDLDKLLAKFREYHMMECEE
ncbi:MAG: PqqD family peptide modification chaperone, partial [Lachnospiraceae bacterium]|nr:PqqD family peptide modification chaperone [Lachnospiraceae bacterium]